MVAGLHLFTPLGTGDPGPMLRWASKEKRECTDVYLHRYVGLQKDVIIHLGAQLDLSNAERDVSRAQGLCTDLQIARLLRKVRRAKDPGS